ncbi:hypothetical protein V8C86DRAFT_466401 [Haematococcus lacustris]
MLKLSSALSLSFVFAPALCLWGGSCFVRRLFRCFTVYKVMQSCPAAMQLVRVKGFNAQGTTGEHRLSLAAGEQQLGHHDRP